MSSPWNDCIIGIVIDPLCFLPDIPNKFKGCCTGAVNVATDSLKKHPSWSKSESGSVVILLGGSWSDPTATGLLNSFGALLTLEVVTSIVESRNIRAGLLYNIKEHSHGL